MKGLVIGTVIGSLLGFGIVFLVPTIKLESRTINKEIAWCEQVRVYRQQQGLSMTGFIWGNYCRDIQDMSIDYQVRARRAMSERASER